jgi:hypothetical protein
MKSKRCLNKFKRAALFAGRAENYMAEAHFAMPWATTPRPARYKVTIGHASIVTDGNRISAEVLQAMSEMPVVALADRTEKHHL